MSDLETFKSIKEVLISQNHSPEDIAQVEKAYKALRMQGIKAEIYGKPFEEIVKELYEIVKRYCSDSFL